MRLLAAPSLAVVIVACNQSTRIQFSADEIAIEPASALASLAPGERSTGFQMPITITNRSKLPIYYEPGVYVVERSKQDGGWQSAWTPRRSKSRTSPSAMLTVPPGRSVTVDIDTRGSGLGPTTLYDGQYRVRFALVVNRIGGFAPLPKDLSVSTPFSVVGPNRING
jgi:hypothetical protein